MCCGTGLDAHGLPSTRCWCKWLLPRVDGDQRYPARRAPRRAWRAGLLSARPTCRYVLVDHHIIVTVEFSSCESRSGARASAASRCLLRLGLRTRLRSWGWVPLGRPGDGPPIAWARISAVLKVRVVQEERTAPRESVTFLDTSPKPQESHCLVGSAGSASGLERAFPMRRNDLARRARNWASKPFRYRIVTVSKPNSPFLGWSEPQSPCAARNCRRVLAAEGICGYGSGPGQQRDPGPEDHRGTLTQSEYVRCQRRR